MGRVHRACPFCYPSRLKALEHLEEQQALLQELRGTQERKDPAE